MLTRSKTYLIAAENDFGSNTGVICTAFNAGVTTKKSTLKDGEVSAESSSKRDINFFSLVLEDESGALPPGVRFGVPSRLKHTQAHVPTNTVKNPPLSFMLKNPATGRRTDMAVITPVVKTRVPPEHPDSARYDNSQLYGHALIIADLMPTDEQKAGEENSFQATIKTTDCKLMTDYASLTSPGQTYEAVVRVFEDPHMVEYDWEPEMYFDNWIHQLSAAVIEQESEPSPNPKPTPFGERPAYYGDTKILVAMVTVHDFCDAEPEDKSTNGYKITESAGIFKQICTILHTYTVKGDGSISHNEKELSSFVAMVDVQKTEIPNPPDPPTYSREWPDNQFQIVDSGTGEAYYRTLRGAEAVQDIYYFYAPSGDGIPAVIVSADEWKWDESFTTTSDPLAIAEQEDFGPDFIGSQESATFAMIYADGEKIIYDLGDHAPPRPLLKGVLFDQLTDRFAALNYNTSTPGEESRTVSFREDLTDSSYLLNYKIRSSYEHSVRDQTTPWDDSEGKRTRRRIVGMAQTPITQKIHAHCGAGVMAILVTNKVIAGAKCSWYVSMARESDGQLLYRGGNIFIGSKFGEQLPLESSCWISLSLLQPMKKDSSGNITQEAVLLCSVQPPRTTFVGAYASDTGLYMHNNQSRSDSRTMTDYVNAARHFDTYSEQRISRDSGLTWQTFIKGMPGDGFYLGTALKQTDFSR